MFTRTLAALLMIFSSAAFAQDGKEDVPVPGITDGLFPVLTKLGIALLVIVVMIYVVTLVLRKFSLGRAGLLGGKGSLEVLERSYFAPKKFVCLLRVEKKMLLVGVSENSINLVADVSDQEFTSLQKKPGKEGGSSFTDYFKQARTQLSTIVSKV